MECSQVNVVLRIQWNYLLIFFCGGVNLPDGGIEDLCLSLYEHREFTGS